VKPRLLDLFCGAGGAAMGYHRAGFEVVGVDIKPQPRYPFKFVQDDIAGWVRVPVALFRCDAIHASPPCQDYSRAMRHLAAPQPRLIDPVIELLKQTGLPWIVENVDGAPIPTQTTLDGRYGVELCGTAFGLSVYRHRLFEASFPVHGSPCRHVRYAMNPHSVAGRERIYAEHGRQDPEILWRKEMGVEWMGRYEAREAVPPVFTEFLGCQLLTHVEAREAA
jgi:DNA (cytosine-5)-methyltransferase 1